MIHDSEVRLNLNLGSGTKRMFAKRPTLIADSSYSHLELHVQNPPVPHLRWDIADEVMRAAATLADESTWFHTTAPYRDHSAAKAMYQNELDLDPDVPEAQLFGNDLQLLIDSQFAIDTGMTRDEFERHAESFSYVRLFSVVESRNDVLRRRIIGWPRALNEAELRIKNKLKEQHHCVRFYAAHEIRDEGTKLKHAASLDFKKFFQEFALYTQEFWCFHYKNRVYKLTTIPTGAVFPPLFAQALSRTLLSLAVRKANVTSYVKQDCNIDNLRLMSDNVDALWAAWHVLLELCDAIGATIGEMNPPPQGVPTPYTYLGMRFSVVQGFSRVELADKSKKKIDEAVTTLETRKELLVADALALFGQTVWASTVTGFKLGKLYYVIKFVRRIQSQPLHAYVRVWPSIVELWRDALITMKTLFFERRGDATIRTTMYTDACESGWGVVIVNFGNRPIRVFAGRWSNAEAAESINLLELRAVRIGLRVLAQLKFTSDTVALELYVDNTTARAWATRARARQWIANELALQIADECLRFQIQLESISYVKSYQNPADKPSRQ